MPSRREFLKDVASGTAGLVLVPQAGGPVRPFDSAQGRRREVSVGGRRVKVVDVHGHCLVPEVLDVIKDPALAGTVKNTLAGGTLALGPERLRYMDEQGIDVQALSINAFWYGTDRDVARQIVTIQNEKLAAWCAARPDRFVGCSDRRKRWKRGAVGTEVRSVLGQGGGARDDDFRAPAAGSGNHPESTAAGKGRPRQYSGRSDALCGRGSGADCRALKKRPSEYFKKELFVDTMVFHEEGLRHLGRRSRHQPDRVRD